MRRVVVTGIGCITAGGNVEQSWESVLNKKSWVKKNTKFDITNFKSKIASFVNIDDDFIKKNINIVSIKEKKRMDEVSYIAILSTYEALQDANIIDKNSISNECGKIEIEKSFNKEKFGTFIGSGIGGIKSFQEGVKTLFTRGENRVSPFFFPSCLVNMCAGDVALKFGLEGAVMTHVSACASSTHSIGEAFNYIREGKLDYCVAGGSEMFVCEIGVAGFDAMNALSTKYNENPEKASRPLDKDRDGFVIGEGSAILVLEELESARKRNAKIYCEIVGFGATCDAYHITSPSPNGVGASRTMVMALKDADLDIKDVDYINLHGTSTAIGDDAEITAIKNTFNSCVKKIAISSTKSITGHLLGSAGAIEAIFCVKALKEQIIPPSINIDNIDENCKDLNIITEPKKQHINIVLSNSFGFGGTNGSLIFKKYQN